MVKGLFITLKGALRSRQTTAVRTMTCTRLCHPPSRNGTELILRLMTIKSTKMEIDTGASLTIVSEHTLREQWLKLTVLPSRVKLHSYSGEAISVLGIACGCGC